MLAIETLVPSLIATMVVFLAGCVTQTIFLSTYLRMAHGDVLSERGSSLPHLAQLTMLVGNMLPSFVHQEVDSCTRTACM